MYYVAESSDLVDTVYCTRLYSQFRICLVMIGLLIFPNNARAGKSHTAEFYSLLPLYLSMPIVKPKPQHLNGPISLQVLSFEKHSNFKLLAFLPVTQSIELNKLCFCLELFPCNLYFNKMPSNASKENNGRLRSFKNLSKDKDVSKRRVCAAVFIQLCDLKKFRR